MEEDDVSIEANVDIEEDGDEEDDDLSELDFGKEGNGLVKFSIESVLYALSGTVIMYLDNVDINVVVRNVIKIKVMLIY